MTFGKMILPQNFLKFANNIQTNSIKTNFKVLLIKKLKKQSLIRKFILLILNKLSSTWVFQEFYNT